MGFGMRWGFAEMSGAPLSESGFAGLEDFQDATGARVFHWRALAGIRIGEKRKMGEAKS